MLALGLSLAMASKLGLQELFGRSSDTVLTATDPNWFVGALALLALFQLLRYAQTHARSSLACGAAACLGIWIFRDGNAAPMAAVHSSYFGLHGLQLLFSVVLIGIAGWLEQADRHKVEVLQEAQAAQIQHLHQSMERLQSSQSALEAKLLQRTQDLHLALAQLEAASALDALTGVANRKRFDEVLQMEWGRAARSRKALSIALIDVDWLSNFNAHYGHDKGDVYLCRMVQVLQSGVMRSGDLIARYRGGCFALLAPDTDASGMLSIANYLCQEVLELNLPHKDSPLGRISISVGLATSLKPEARKAEALLIRAQAALALAKSQGRNQVVAG